MHDASDTEPTRRLNQGAATVQTHAARLRTTRGDDLLASFAREVSKLVGGDWNICYFPIY